MSFLSDHKIISAVGIAVAVLIAIVVIEFLMIKNNGKPVAVPDIPRSAEVFGTGTPLTFVVFGDSTSVGQGGEYERGIARGTAKHLARDNQVTLHNFGVSGARTADVVHKQLPQAAQLRPDVVLLAVTANDVTHLTSISSVRKDLTAIIDSLRARNPDVDIILTGSPQMGSVPRFPEPIKSLARYRTGQINRMVNQLAADKGVIFARIADRTGKLFLENQSYFAQDNFHPTSAGYETWTPVITQAYDQQQR